MKHKLIKNQKLLHKNLNEIKPIVIYWVGGSYGNFVYRILHRYLESFPFLEDNFLFKNGSSHEIIENQYCSDVKFVYPYKIHFKIKQDIEFENFCIKSHCSQKIQAKNSPYYSKSKLNIKIVFSEKKDAIFSFLQNFLKLNVGDDFEKYQKMQLKWLYDNEIKYYDIIHNDFCEMLSSIHKNWYEYDNFDTTINIYMNDILNEERFLKKITEIKNYLNVDFKKAIDNYYEDHKKFLTSQMFIDYYLNAKNGLYDNNNIVSKLLKDLK